MAAVKDDRFDAFVLADTLRHEHQHWRALAVPSPLLAEIRALPRDRDRLLETQQAIESQLRMILEAYHPAPVRLFSSIDRQITLHFVLDYPTPQTASRIKTTRMAGFLDRHHYTGRVSAQVLADRMRRHLLSASTGHGRGQVVLHPVVHPAAAAAELPARRLRGRDRRRGRRASRRTDLRQLPRHRPRPDRGALAEIGEDRSRFPPPAVLLAESGLAPVTRASGRSRNVRFRYAANTRLREASMWWADNSMKDAPWAAAAFRDARDHRGQRFRIPTSSGSSCTDRCIPPTYL